MCTTFSLFEICRFEYDTRKDVVIGNSFLALDSELEWKEVMELKNFVDACVSKHTARQPINRG